MAAILTFLVTFVTQFFTRQAAIALVWKVILFNLIIVVLPTILYKLITFIIEGSVNWAMGKINSAGIQPLSLQLVSFGGYIANEVGLPACFAMFMSALSLRFMLSLIQSRV